MDFSPMRDDNVPLPQCEGPKLDPFPDSKSTITFRRLLDSGTHAHVFEATIDSTAYALKLFRFYDFQCQRDGLVGKENNLVPDNLLQAHSDPFYNECRAYGRLQEANLNGKVAVRCYGYILIPAEIERQLQRDFQVDDWHRSGSDYLKPVSSRQPIRAIVKELVSQDEPLTGKVADKMLRDLKRIRSKGIYIGDVHERNYETGLLVDMSTARTLPHYLFDIRGPKQRARMINSDLYMWEGMREALKLNTRLRAVRDEKYCAKLRPRKTKKKKKKKSTGPRPKMLVPK